MGLGRETPALERSDRPVEERAETRFRLRADDRVGTGKHAGVQQIARAPAERDARQHRVRRTRGREESRSGDVAVGGVVNAAEIVRDGIGDIVAHAHRAGVMMRGAEIVAPVFERAERWQGAGPACRPEPGSRGSRLREFRRARRRRRSVRSCRKPRPFRSRWSRSILVSALPGKCCGVAFALPSETTAFGRLKSVSVVDRSTKLSGLRGVISPIPRIVITTVSSVARSMSRDAQGSGSS